MPFTQFLAGAARALSLAGARVPPSDPACLGQPGAVGILCLRRGGLGGTPGHHDAAQPHSRALHGPLRLLPRPGALFLLCPLAPADGGRPQLTAVEGVAGPADTLLVHLDGCFCTFAGLGILCSSCSAPQCLAHSRAL